MILREGPHAQAAVADRARTEGNPFFLEENGCGHSSETGGASWGFWSAALFFLGKAMSRARSRFPAAGFPGRWCRFAARPSYAGGRKP